jgi:hypothetical protein
MRPGRGLLLSGAILAVLSVAGIGVAVWMLFSSVAGGVNDAVTAPRLAVPGHQTLHLRSGSYLVYGRVDLGGGTGLTAVSVSTPDGRTLATTSTSWQTLTRDSDEFRSVAAFTAPSDGQYTVSLEGRVGSQAIVAPGLAHIFGGVSLAATVGVICAMAFLAGIVLLIVGAVRRSSSRRPEGGPPQYPPGYPPPTGYPPGYPPQNPPPPGSSQPPR